MEKIGILILSLLYGTMCAQDARLGINFPFRAPEVAGINDHMARIEGSGAKIYRQMSYADVIWRHVEPADDSWDFRYPDSVFFGHPNHEYVANLYSLTISNANNGNVGFQVPWRACTGNPSCGWKYELDSAATIDYLKKSISRYAGEVLYWELGNETQNGTFPLGIPNLPFIDFVKHNYRWIKSINPDVKVLLPGTVGTYGFPMKNSYDWLRLMFSNGMGNHIDIFSFHDYNAWWTTPLHIDSIISIRNDHGLGQKEVWITESSVSSTTFSPITPAYSSIDEQAADVWRRAVIAWAKGVKTFFWHGGWSSGPPSEWAEFGLLDQFGRKKKSCHSFKLLADEIAEFSSAQIESIGVVNDDNTSSDGGNGAWVFKFVVDSRTKYVMWSRNNQTFELRPNTNVEYSITQVVPSSISADGETPTFSTNTVSVNAGEAHVFSLSSLPILVVESVVASTDDSNWEELITVYPNPATSHVQIKNRSHHHVDVMLFDVSGRTVAGTLVSPLLEASIRVEDMPRGIYFYRIKSQDGMMKNGRIFID